MSEALAINNLAGGGIIIGYSVGRVRHATLWGFGGQVIALETRIAEGDPLFNQVELDTAYGINDTGSIVATGFYRGSAVSHAFLLTPVE